MMRAGVLLLVALALAAPGCLCAFHQVRPAVAHAGCCGEPQGSGKNPAPARDDCRDQCAKAFKQDRDVQKTTSLQGPEGMGAPVSFPEPPAGMAPVRREVAGVFDVHVAPQGPPAYLRFHCLRC